MIYHAEMEGRVVKQWFVMGSACRFMALAGLLCLALLLSGCGTTYISAPDYGGRYDTSSLGARVAQTARSQIGAHYRLGGTTPKGFDCSGLIWWAYRQHGINVPRVTDAQGQGGYGVGRGIAMSRRYPCLRYQSRAHGAPYRIVHGRTGVRAQPHQRQACP